MRRKIAPAGFARGAAHQGITHRRNETRVEVYWFLMEKRWPKVGVGVMLLKGDKVLLGRRHSDPAKADSDLHGEGTWTLLGGKVEFHEALEDCAVREAREETGIAIDKSALELLSVTDDMVPDNHFVTVGFLCREFSGEARVMEPDEIVEWRWFPLTDLPKPLFKPSEKMLLRYRAVATKVRR